MADTERAWRDLHHSSLFRNAIEALTKLHPDSEYRYVRTLDHLSHRNLNHVRASCMAINETERTVFLNRFRNLHWYWKHSTSVIDIVKKTKSLNSITYLVEKVHGVTVYEDADEDDEQVYFAKTLEKPRGVKISSTAIPELKFRGDGGFIFFRYNLGSGPMPQTRFGSTHLVLDPVGDRRLHTDGWVTLRDVYLPYAWDDFWNEIANSNRFIISHDNAQRATTYKDLSSFSELRGFTGEDKFRKIQESEARKYGAKLEDKLDALYPHERQVVQHEFFGDGARSKTPRLEHVLEGAFHGQDINDGIAYSAMRAFWELKPLWNEVIAEDRSQETFLELMQQWMHRFFHIEAKFPWKLTLPEITNLGSKLGESSDLEGWSFGDQGARIFYEKRREPTGRLTEDPATDFGPIDYASDAEVDAATGWP